MRGNWKSLLKVDCHSLITLRPTKDLTFYRAQQTDMGTSPSHASGPTTARTAQLPGKSSCIISSVDHIQMTKRVPPACSRTGRL